MAAASALEMVGASDNGASQQVAKLITALTQNDHAGTVAAIASLMEMSRTSMALAICNQAQLEYWINASILQDSAPAIMKWLFELAGQGSLPDFVLHFIPTLTWAFLRRLNSPTPASNAGVILEAMCENNRASASLDERFQLESGLPDLSQPSIYHKPKEGQKSSVTSLTLNRLRDHDLRSRIASMPTLDDGYEPIALGAMDLVRGVLARFILSMPNMSSLAISNFCILSIRLCSDEETLFTPFTDFVWDLPREMATFHSQSQSTTDLELLLVRGLIHAVITEGCRAVATAAITTLHGKAVQDLDPAVLLSTTCLMERLRYEI